MGEELPQGAEGRVADQGIGDPLSQGEIGVGLPLGGEAAGGEAEMAEGLGPDLARLALRGGEADAEAGETAADLEIELILALFALVLGCGPGRKLARIGLGDRPGEAADLGAESAKEAGHLSQPGPFPDRRQAPVAEEEVGPLGGEGVGKLIEIEIVEEGVMAPEEPDGRLGREGRAVVPALGGVILERPDLRVDRAGLAKEGLRPAVGIGNPAHRRTLRYPLREWGGRLRSCAKP